MRMGLEFRLTMSGCLEFKKIMLPISGDFCECGLGFFSSPTVHCGKKKEINLIKWIFICVLSTTDFFFPEAQWL